jgi:4-amino-4-deoxy-L-arabinose transferase-like glycosyltransferase
MLDRRALVALLVIAWAVAYLPNLGTRPLRLEEGRRATPAREMLASGDFVRPTLYGDTYLNKPPLYYWLVAAVGSVLGGVTPLAVRLPSALAALGCALVALRFAPKDLSRETRALAAVLVLASATLLDKGTLGEIDASLCLLVAAALKCWWDGNRADGQTLGSWLAVGILLGVAGLLKGPAGPALFYLAVGPFLIWQGQWRRLLSAGHVACLGLVALPSAIWVSVLFERGVVSAPELAGVWLNQLGADPAAGDADLVQRYATFPLQLLGMLFPAVLWLPAGLRRLGETDEVRRFLVCAVVVPVVVFYVYPGARPRHLMPVVFPAAVLAATTVAALGRTRIAVALSAMMLAGWGLYNVAVVPWQAERSPTRVALRAVEDKLPPDEPVYTTRTFPGKDGVYFNLQFHLAADVRAAADLPALRRAAPCLAVVTPVERKELEGSGCVVEEVGRLNAPGGPPEVHVVRLGPPGG